MSTTPLDLTRHPRLMIDRTRDMIDEVRACIDQLLEDMLAGISPAEREEFARFLTIIGTNLGARRDNKVPVNG